MFPSQTVFPLSLRAWKRVWVEVLPPTVCSANGWLEATLENIQMKTLRYYVDSRPWVQRPRPKEAKPNIARCLRIAYVLPTKTEIKNRLVNSVILSLGSIGGR